MVDQLLRLSFTVIAKVIILVRPLMPAVCFIAAWSIVVLAVWHIFSSINQGIKQVKRLHRIPCASCSYATDSHYLKCPLHPSLAFSEEAIDCQDFEAKTAHSRQQPLTLG